MSQTVQLPPVPSCAAGKDTHNLSQISRSRPLWTYCPDSIPQTTLKMEPKPYHLSPQQQHYQQIKDLVEQTINSHHPFTSHSSHLTYHTSSHTCSHPTHHSSQRSSVHLPALPSSHLPTSHFPPLPSSHLPAHLISYISQVWNNN